MSTLRRRLYDTWERQFQPDQILHKIRLYIGPDNLTYWSSQGVVCVADFRNLRLPATAGVVVGASGRSIEFERAAVVPPAIEIGLLDQNEELLDQLTDWAHTRTKLRLWIMAYLWMTGYFEPPAIIIPEPKRRELIFHPVQIGKYKRDAPDAAVTDPFDGDAATTVTVGGVGILTFTVASAAGFNIGDVIKIESAAMTMERIIANIVGNQITVTEVIGLLVGGEPVSQWNCYVWGEGE